MESFNLSMRWVLNHDGSDSGDDNGVEVVVINIMMGGGLICNGGHGDQW